MGLPSRVLHVHINDSVCIHTYECLYICMTYLNMSVYTLLHTYNNESTNDINNRKESIHHTNN